MMSEQGTSRTLLGRTPAPSPRVERMAADRAADAPGEQGYTRQLRAVLFTDIVGSTAFFELHGDEAGLALLERVNALLFPLVAGHGGTVVKTIGDAIMASYPTAEQAVLSAAAMQLELRRHEDAALPGAERIRVRIGINYGPLLCREQDLFGDVVNAAARVEALARGGQVLVSGAVQAELGASFPLPCVLFDAVRVKGKQEPLEVYEVRWDPEETRTPATPAPLFSPGTQLGGRFEIVASLGEGGMGQVYHARDLVLDEEVALKFLRPELAREAETLSLFKAEVKLARSISHPGICRMHELLQMEGYTFLSMELVRGRTLARLLRDAQAEARAAGRGDEPGCGLGLEQTLALADGMCAALQAAHERGIIHRDLKLSNVMIEDGSRRVVLMDFGIAELAREAGGEDGRPVLGTPETMSPEALRGEPLGPAADIYSLGVVLFQLLAGRPPFSGDTPQVVGLQHLTAAPPPLAGLVPGLPDHVAAAVARCLAKHPAERFPDAASLARVLHGGELAAASGRAAAARTRQRRSRGLLALALASLLAVAGGVVVLLLGRDAPPPLPPTGEQQAQDPGSTWGAWETRPLVLGPAVERAARWSADGRDLAFLREGEVWLLDEAGRSAPLTRGAAALTGDGLLGLSWKGAERGLLFAAAGAQRGASIHYLPETASDFTPTSPVLVLDRAAAVDCAPDGRSIAFSALNELGTYDLATAHLDGTERRTLLGPDASRSFLGPRFDPTGERLALVVHQLGYASTRDVAVLELHTGKLTLLTQDGRTRRAHNTEPAWTPDGRWVIYASKRSGTMSLWRVPSTGGPSLPLTQGATVDQRSPDVAADGRRVVFATESEQLDVALQPLDGGPMVPLTDDAWPDRFPVFSADGRWVAFRTQHDPDRPDRRLLGLRSLADGAEQLHAAPAGMRDFCWCGDGDALAYSATVGGQRSLGLLRLGEREPRELVQGFHRVWAPSCDPRGRMVVFVGIRRAGEARRLWLLDLQRLEDGPRPLPAGDGFPGFPVWSPSGDRIAFRWSPARDRQGEAELRLLLPDDGVLRTVTADSSLRRSQRRLRFSPDGRWLYYIEGSGPDGRLWQVPSEGGTPRFMLALASLHTLDFDLSADGRALVFARSLRRGDLYVLRPAP